MKIPDKWRGRRILNDEEISGELVKNQLGYLIRVEGGGYAKVKPESLSKLAGYDEEGNEVYRSSKR